MVVEIEICGGSSPDQRPVEIVERKGIGHPDTICDLISERLSVALSKFYLKTFGFILHHNVDKALLSAGRSRAAFGGGEIEKPIDLYLSGRATDDVRGRSVPVRELAELAAGQWFEDNLHAFDCGAGLRLHCITQRGSPELVDLFMRQKDQGVFLANDTSCGVGFASAPQSISRRLHISRFVRRRFYFPPNPGRP